jgi:hypothetical protein
VVCIANGFDRGLRIETRLLFTRGLKWRFVCTDLSKALFLCLLLTIDNTTIETRNRKCPCLSCFHDKYGVGVHLLL